MTSLYPEISPVQGQPINPAPERKRAKVGAAVIVTAGVTAILGGAVGGAVGYGIAHNQESTAVVTTAAAGAAAPAAALPATGNSVTQIAKAVQPAVVQLNVSGASGAGTGSGFVISNDGYIITNNHVAGMSGKDGSIQVQFSDGTTADGKLVGASADYDLAVVKVNKTNLPTIELGSSADLEVGQSVIAIGSPLGLSGTVTTGIVSALDRPVTAGGNGEGTSFIDAIQTDAAINPGNSGGPLVDGAGRVIGINSAIASMGTSAGEAGSIGLGFAIPIDTAKRVTTEIIKNGSASTPVIGVQLDTTFAGPGAKVAVVTDGGAAQAAGLQTGDVISKLDGKILADSTELVVGIRAHAPGDTVTLTIIRDGDTVKVPLTLKASKN